MAIAVSISSLLSSSILQIPYLICYSVQPITLNPSNGINPQEHHHHRVNSATSIPYQQHLTPPPGLCPSILSAFVSSLASQMTMKSSPGPPPSRRRSHPTSRLHRVRDIYPSDKLVAPCEHQDTVVNVAPISEIASHEMIINAAITVGAKKIVLSDCGTNVPELQTTELLSEVHTGGIGDEKIHGE